MLDLNYIVELYGKKCEGEIDCKGALKANARKHFKGTIDFKTGCTEAIGEENEFCMLLSKDAISKSLPMLLATEDDVEGAHGVASGEIDIEELFYLMSRGIHETEAKKMIIKAKFDHVLSNITEDTLKEYVIEQINEKIG